MSNEVFEKVINFAAHVTPDATQTSIVKELPMEEVEKTAADMASLASREGDSPRLTQLHIILEKIDDPNFSVSEISRLIAKEIAAVTLDMHLSHNLGQDPVKLKTFTELVKALRELGRQLEQAEVLSKKDILNFDGVKFQTAVREINECFKKAMKKAGVSDHLVNSTLSHYRDIVAEDEPRIRKLVEEIG